MSAQLLTTGKVARLCSVQPDTVLKWIKKGRLAATRTAGGHYRVDEHDLAPLVTPPKRADPDCPREENHLSRALRCWEYMDNEVRAECTGCVVYKTRAGCCFELVRLLRGAGHSRCYSTGACMDCPYYRRVQGLPINVIVVTRDESLIHTITAKNNPCVAFRFARSGYDASAIISVFRPALVVVGEHVATSEWGLIEALASDPRAPGVRILLGSRVDSDSPLRSSKAIAGVLQRPFCCDEILSWVERFQVEQLATTR
jgi:excisionase family DNA binding protein